MSRSKTEYMCCNGNSERELKIGEEAIPTATTVIASCIKIWNKIYNDEMCTIYMNMCMVSLCCVWIL